MQENETLIWEGHPSQWTNFGLYLLCGLFCWLLAPLILLVWRWIETSNFRYRVTNERIMVTRGVLSKRTDELELYRVKDTVLIEPFWLRLLKLGNVMLISSDRSTPDLLITAVPHAAELREQIRRNVERLRTRKGIRELDVGEVI